MVDKAWANGEISTSAATEIAAGRHDRFADVYAAIEAALVEFAAARHWRELRACIAAYRANCDALDGREPSDRNGVTLSQMAERWALNGNLDSLAGATLDRALKSAMAGDLPADDRTPAKRRADALDEIARYYLDHGELPTEDRRTPHLSIGFDLHTALAGLPCPQVRIWDGPVVSISQLHQLICESNLARMILDTDSVPIDLGRAVRDASRPQRRALARRDGGCRFPGCDRLAWRCHPHHVRWWDHHGPTDLANLVLLCDLRHHVVHRHGWDATFDGTTLTITHDGQPIGHTHNQGTATTHPRPLTRTTPPGGGPRSAPSTDQALLTRRATCWISMRGVERRDGAVRPRRPMRRRDHEIRCAGSKAAGLLQSPVTTVRGSIATTTSAGAPRRHSRGHRVAANHAANDDVYELVMEVATHARRIDDIATRLHRVIPAPC